MRTKLVYWCWTHSAFDRYRDGICEDFYRYDDEEEDEERKCSITATVMLEVTE